uniref:DnaJ domain-containing protein n=1 Tax=Candidatus Kentrum eta TaxID=2126337 RepID=A0A450U8C1_9GAMM|nr:MAG: DnaJ domain-containing protein [Candidatus Kentron sp. H]
MTELEEILHLWQSLQEQYDEITEALRAIIEQINGIDPKERRIRRAFHQIVKRVDGIRKEIEEGSKDAADGIEELQSCYDELAAIHEHIKDGTAHEESAHEREDDETSLDGKIRDCLKTLGLSGSGRVTLQILKTATRKLRRRYHPDRNPAPDATEKTQAINDAYKFLNDCLSRGVELHG